MMNFSKFAFYEARSSANLRNTVSAIDMVDCALYNLGLGLSKTIVDGMCKMLIFHGDAIEMRKGPVFQLFRKSKKKTLVLCSITTCYQEILQDETSKV